VICDVFQFPKSTYDDHLLREEGVVEPEKDAGRGHSEGGPLAEVRQTQPELDTEGCVQSRNV